MTRAAETSGIYVYCITEGRPVTLPRDAHPLRRVYAIARGDLVAVVSEVPLDEFGEHALSGRLQDACWLEREARAHERVVEHVMGGRTVLPMKLCTIFRGEERVRELLETHRAEFRQTLARLRGREEWEMKMFQELVPLAGARPRKPAPPVSGSAYLRQKAAAQAATAKAATEARCQAEQAFAIVAECADEIQLKPVAATSSPTAPRLILDAVCLLAKAQVPVLRRQLESLGKELADKGTRFQLVGPWPPYHFAGEVQEYVALS